MTRRPRPWLAFLAALAFVLAGIVAAGHDHDDASAGRGADCSTCTLAHAPALAPATTALPAPVLLSAEPTPAATPAAPARTPARRAAPRAPPTT